MTAPDDSQKGRFFDLTTRIKLRVVGNDRVRFLNGQVTNDLNKATTKNAVAACVLNVKGRIDAHVFLSCAADAIFLDSDPEIREKLQSRVERYIIADDVQIEDVSSRWALYHVLSAEAPASPPVGRL